MKHTFPVTVVDDERKPVAGAKVCLVEGDELPPGGHPYKDLLPTHDDKGSGNYEESARTDPTVKGWALVVTLQGKSPVVQPLNFKQSGGEFTAVPWPSPVATVTITNTHRTVGGIHVREIAFHVVLFSVAEVVFIGGLSFGEIDITKKGTQFHLYGSNRAKVLRFLGKIHAGTIVTTFSTSKMFRKKQVFGLQKKGAAAKDIPLIDIEIFFTKHPEKRVLGTTPYSYQPRADVDISIVDFYKYLQNVGARDPGSVKEIGIFSHSYPGGPILFDTNDSKKGKDERADDDFDARFKDFNKVNFPNYLGMVNAPAPDCRFFIWGCSATTHFKQVSLRALREIRKGTGENTFFLVKSEVRDHRDERIILSTTEENLTELHHRFNMDQEFRFGGYAAILAAALDVKGVQVRAACPGVGSDPLRVNGIDLMKVKRETYGLVYEYFHEKFTRDFETTSIWDYGYVDYHAMQKRPELKKPPFSSQYYKLLVKLIPPSGERKQSILTFGNGHFINDLKLDVKVTMKAAPDLFTKGMMGHLFIIEDKSTYAILVQEDEQTFWVGRDAQAQWTTNGGRATLL